jgi:hypothetical protein
MRFWLYALAALIAMSFISRRPKDTLNESVDVTAALDGQLEQAESMFAFHIIERAADRTNDDLRAIDVDLNGLLAGQAAIYAILIDKIDEFPWILRIAFIGAIMLAAFNLVLGRGKNVPDPQSFREAHVENTTTAREDVSDVLLRRAAANDRLLVLKRRLFWLALGLTVAASLAVPVLRQHAQVAAPLPAVIQSKHR